MNCPRKKIKILKICIGARRYTNGEWERVMQRISPVYQWVIEEKIKLRGSNQSSRISNMSVLVSVVRLEIYFPTPTSRIYQPIGEFGSVILSLRCEILDFTKAPLLFSTLYSLYPTTTLTPIILYIVLPRLDTALYHVPSFPSFFFFCSFFFPSPLLHLFYFPLYVFPHCNSLSPRVHLPLYSLFLFISHAHHRPFFFILCYIFFSSQISFPARASFLLF